MKKRLCKIISIVAVFLMLISSTVIPAFASSQKLDFSINHEIAQATDVRSAFLNCGAERRDAENLKELAEEYIPEGARCTEFGAIGDTIYTDYQINNTRYLVAYYSDGTVEKYVRTINGNDIYLIDSKNPTPQHTNVAETRQIATITEEEALCRMEEVKKSQGRGVSEYPLEETSARATTVVYPLRYTSVSSTAPYKAKNVLSGNLYLSALSGTGYSTSQPYTIYETMSYHTEVTRNTQPFAIGATIFGIATTFLVAPSTVEVWLTVADVVFSAAGKLEEACKVVEENAYTYQGGKECGIFDPTTENRKVEVYSLWGQGRITMTWSYNSSTGYNNPTWGHSARSAALQESNTSIRSEGQRIYNAQIVTYGTWQWGVGNGFGY